MTATLNDATKQQPAESSAEQQAATELVRLAKEQGLSLAGPDGLLKQLSETVIEIALSERAGTGARPGLRTLRGTQWGNHDDCTRAERLGVNLMS